MPFIFVAARSSKEDSRMRARFAMLQTGGAGGLSSNKQADLLKGSEGEPTGKGAAAIARMSSWLGMDKLLLQANSQQKPRAVLRNCGIVGLGTGLLVLFGTRTPLLSLLLGALAQNVPWVLLRLRAKQRTAAMNNALPQVLDMISRALRAGHSLPAALGIVAEETAEPARSAFTEVFQKQKFGLPLRDALMELVRCFPSEDLKVLVTAILVQKDTGGNLVQILDRTSMVIRERLKLQGDVRVHTAQGRMTGWILCLLPLLMLAMLMISNPSYPRVLWDDPLGRKLMYCGVVLLGVGAFVIQRIVKGIEV
ncbi:MAG: type II secretion system F family protein [Janthinobacterium lividum]